MNSRQTRLLLLGMLLCLLRCSGAQASTWQALYVFGESYSDSGAGYVDGNGPTAVVYLAAYLGIPFAYAGDPNASGKSLNFAVSGAQMGNAEGSRIQQKLPGLSSKKLCWDAACETR